MSLTDRGLDHRRPVDTEHPTPYVGTEHAALLRLVPEPPTVQKRRQEAALLASQQVTEPTDGSGEAENYRLHLLLHSGVKWDTRPTARIRGRHPRLVALSRIRATLSQVVDGPIR